VGQLPAQERGSTFNNNSMGNPQLHLRADFKLIL
jgi:hypothetical protein